MLRAVAWQEGVLVSRHANRACSLGTAMLTVRGITGRSIKKSAKNELPSYAMRRYSRTHHQPPTKEDCPICFLPMPLELICCVSLPSATISSVPIHNYAEANEELSSQSTEEYYECCGKSICRGCIHSFIESGNDEKCPFCNCDRAKKTDEDDVKELLQRVEVNDAGAIYVLGNIYHVGLRGLQQDRAKALELWKQAAELGSSIAHYNLGAYYYEG